MAGAYKPCCCILHNLTGHKHTNFEEWCPLELCHMVAWAWEPVFHGMCSIATVANLSDLMEHQWSTDHLLYRAFPLWIY